MFQGRFQDLKNDLLVNTVDARAQSDTPEGFDCLYHQDQQLSHEEDTSL